MDGTCWASRRDGAWRAAFRRAGKIWGSCHFRRTRALTAHPVHGVAEWFHVHVQCAESSRVWTMERMRDDGNGKNRDICVFEERVRRQRILPAGLQSGPMGVCCMLKICRVRQRHVCKTNWDEIRTAVSTRSDGQSIPFRQGCGRHGWHLLDEQTG